MKSDRRAPVAIIGAGFSGTMVAANLARLGIGSILIEPGDVAGQGTAFSTRDPAHLLNVPAGNMSAWPDLPDDFASRAGAGPGDFAERRHFGGYLRAILDEAIAGGHAQLVRDRAVAARRDEGGWRIDLEGGDSISAQALVLAIGNQLPAPLRFDKGAGELVIDNPWGARARAAIEDSVSRRADVFIVGTGLTMVDVVLSLDSAGHEGRIVALSRRGLLPKSHDDFAPAPVEWAEIPTGGLRDLIGWLRARSSAASWRAAIDSLRPHSQRLWQSLGLEQKRLFLRHARPWWDVHRHRIAPEVAHRLSELIADGRLRVLAGRVAVARQRDGSVDVTIRRRGGSAEFEGNYAYIFNCTGPLGEIAGTRDTLLRQLLDDGLAHPDELGIGVAVDDRSRAENSDRLWALGALTKGRYWEIIAVPDIRHQATQVAADIATELGR